MHRCWRPSSPPKKLLATSLVKILQSQIDEYRRCFTAAFGQHPDHDVFGSLPGAGEKLAPQLSEVLATAQPEPVIL